MKIKAVVIIITIIFFLPVSPSTAVDITEPVIIAKSDSARYNSISFDNDKVAWIEYGFNEDDSLASSVHSFDIKTGRQGTVIVDPSGKFSLDLSGNRYVWSDNRGIFLYDDDEKILTFLYSANAQYNPVIDGDIIVWEERDKNRSFLRMYDIKSKNYSDEILNQKDYCDYYYPAISKNNLAFIEKNKKTLEINLIFCNLTSGVSTYVSDLPYIYQPPSIDADKIVWTGKNKDDYSVFIYDTNTGAKKILSAKPGYQMYPDVSNGNVVWVYYKDSGRNFSNGGDIFLFDINTNNCSMISPPEEKQDFPKVSKDFVVWTDRRGSAHDIYLYAIPQKTGEITEYTNFNSENAFVTPNPTPDTKVRYYSSLCKGDTQWYSIEPSEDDKAISFELRWKDDDTNLFLSVASPDNSMWRFSDEDDNSKDCSVRMTISDIKNRYYPKKAWTIAVSGEFNNDNKTETFYDICWY